jgi:hypothetical protein
MAEQNTRIRGEADDPGVGPGVVITGSAQSFDPPGRFIIVSTAGTLTGKLVGDSSDVAYILPTGVHKLAVKSVTSVTSLVGCIVR